MIALIPENKTPQQDLIKLENKGFTLLFRYRNKWRKESSLSIFSFKKIQKQIRKSSSIRVLIPLPAYSLFSYPVLLWALNLSDS